MHLYLIRHGQTEENKYNIIAGQSDGTLSASGKKQSLAIARFFSDISIDAIYCSDLGRVQQTAAPTLDQHSHAYSVFDSRLRERDQGILTGKSKSSIQEEFGENLDNIRESHPSVETKDAMNLRMKEIFDEIVSKHKNTNDTVVVFSHHAFLHVAIKYFHQEYFATRLVPGRIENASITHYHITGESAQIIIENDTSHL